MNDTLVVAILPNIVTSILALIVWQFKRSISKREEERRKEKEKLLAEQQERDAKIQTLISSMAYATQQIEVVREEYRAIKRANAKYDEQIKEIVDSIRLIKTNSLVTTKERLTRIFQKAQEKGSVHAHTKECVAEIMKSYEELGGNSYVHSEYQKFMALPTEK